VAAEGVAEEEEAAAVARAATADSAADAGGSDRCSPSFCLLSISRGVTVPRPIHSGGS